MNEIELSFVQYKQHRIGLVIYHMVSLFLLPAGMKSGGSSVLEQSKQISNENILHIGVESHAESCRDQDPKNFMQPGIRTHKIRIIGARATCPT